MMFKKASVLFAAFAVAALAGSTSMITGNATDVHARHAPYQTIYRCPTAPGVPVVDRPGFPGFIGAPAPPNFSVAEPVCWEPHPPKTANPNKITLTVIRTILTSVPITLGGDSAGLATETNTFKWLETTTSSALSFVHATTATQTAASPTGGPTTTKTTLSPITGGAKTTEKPEPSQNPSDVFYTGARTLDLFEGKAAKPPSCQDLALAFAIATTLLQLIEQREGLLAFL